jgi:hypothetical protein
MPHPGSAAPDVPRRRALLGGAAALAALAAAGCSTTAAHRGAGDSVRATAAPDPDAAVRRRSLQVSEALLGRYDAALAGYPALAAELGPLRAELTAHARAFGGSGAAPAASPTASPVPASGGRAAVLAALATAERETAQARAADLAAASPPLARLIASVAASNAVHAHLLGSTT